MEEKVENLIKDKALRQASGKISQLKKEVEGEKDIHIEILKDVINDNKDERTFIKKVTYTLLIAIFVAIFAFVGLFIYSQNQVVNMNNALMDFFNTYDMYSIEQSIDYTQGDVKDSGIINPPVINK